MSEILEKDMTFFHFGSYDCQKSGLSSEGRL